VAGEERSWTNAIVRDFEERAENKVSGGGGGDRGGGGFVCGGGGGASGFVSSPITKRNERNYFCFVVGCFV
jgi:hypothetical protein